jgi:TolB protein
MFSSAYPTRRKTLAMFGGSLIAMPALLRGVPAQAQLRVDLRGGSFQPLPIAITDFVGDAQGQQIAAVITNNLKRSGYFAPLPREKFPEVIANPDAAPNLAAWKAAGAQAVITGRVGAGGASTQFRLWDTGENQQAAGQQYNADPASWRRIAHKISDAVWERIIGEGGFFDSRVVFVDETGPKDKRRKRIALMDQDGANPRFLTTGADLVATPRFAPSNQQIAYMSFDAQGNARVFVHSLASNQRQMVGNFPGMSFSPRFSPDSARLVMSLQEGGNTNIYLMGIGGGQPVRLTETSAIDTSPSFSPDGRQIVFESDRGGGQQLYVMGSDGSGQRRISFGDGRYASPVWSPKGDLIAFTKLKSGSFSIGVMRPDGQGERILTEGFHNEGPTWSPNGRFLMFFRDPGGNSGGKIYMVDVTGKVEVPVPTPNFGSDPAWSPLLT